MANGKEQNKTTIEDTLKLIEKTFGKGSIMRLGDKPNINVDVIPSGSLLLDHILGVGGYPRGRVIEIFGPESSGKTTLALHAIAEVQKLGGRAAFIDVEHAIDPEYSQRVGVKIDELILSQPDYGEQALEIVEMLAKSGTIDLIVLDSVAALVPQSEFEGQISDNSVGSQARLMSKALRKLAGVMSRSNCCVIFINQLREKVGVLYGNPETTSGGRALKFYASIRIDIRKSDAIKQGSDNIIGNFVNVRIIKNKVAPPLKTCKLEIIYGKGIGKINELIDLALEFGLLKRAGSWYEIGDRKIGQGRDTVKLFFETHPDDLSKLDIEIRQIASAREGVIEESED